MLTVFATFLKESGSPECFSINFRAFQISTGSARGFGVVSCGPYVSSILIIPESSESRLGAWRCAFLANSSPNLGVLGKTAAFILSNFCKEKAKQRGAGKPSLRYESPSKEVTMEYLILVAVVSMIALYALIIVGCLRQPEWQ